MLSTLHQETLKEYEAAANIDMDSRLNKRLFDQAFSQQRSHISWRIHLNIFCSVKMEFGELKAEAYSSLSILQNTQLSNKFLLQKIESFFHNQRQTVTLVSLLTFAFLS